MRGPLALFVLTLVLIATGLAAYSALGIVRNSDDPAAGVTVTSFGQALEQDDGKRACALLTAVARNRIEQDRKKPCEEGILELASELGPRGEVARVDVAENSGFVTTSGGSTFFLGKTASGWKLSAAGCERQAGDAPYSCSLEA